jgi:hypothetical protein
MRRLFAADSLRSDNRCSLDTAPHCGAELMRRLFAADSLTGVTGRVLVTPGHRCGAIR